MIASSNSSISSSKKRQVANSPASQFTSIHDMVESDDLSVLNAEDVSFLSPERRDPDNLPLMMRSNGDFYDFSETLNMDMFDNTESFLSHNTSMDDDSTAAYFSANNSESSSPENIPQIKSESPAASQRSSFSMPKNPSTSSSQTSIANQAEQKPVINVAEKKPSKALANYQFGREVVLEDAPEPSDQASSTTKPDGTTPPKYMPNFNADDWKNTDNVKYQIQVEDLPAKSRVETQIKVVMNFYPPPAESIVHLPADTISKPKLQLRHTFTPIPSALTVDTIVVCESNHNKHVNICQGCLKRERKRAFRKKVRLPVEEAHWRQDKEKRAIVFNCREVVDFGPVTNIDVNGKSVPSRQVQLPMRMACYCRHHNEKTGFRALFVVRDYLGNVVARATSSSIVITDDHKAANQKSIGVKRPNSGLEEAVSPNVQDDPPRKRKAESLTPTFNQHSRSNSRTSLFNPSPQFSPAAMPSFDIAVQSPLSPQQNAYRRTSSMDSLSALMSRPMSVMPSPKDSPYNVMSPSRQSEDAASSDRLPVIQRIIPASGSIRGGIEVTLLGSSFVNGLITKFGENKSMSTHCWNDTTIVTHLPPSRVAGPVVVTFEGFAMADPQVFSYFDDTDRQLIELALQVVGLKMNGRLEDARDIARRIVGSGTGFDSNSSQTLQNTAGATNRSTNIPTDELETLLMKCLDLVDSDASSFTPNWQLSNSEGQTMLHLASCLGLNRFASALLDRGSRLDIQDKSGYTALHFAGLHQNKELMDLYLAAGANSSIRSYTGETYLQLNELSHTSTAVSQRNYQFNGRDSDSEDDSEYDSDFNDSEASDTILEEEEEEEPARARTFVSYFNWRGKAARRKPYRTANVARAGSAMHANDNQTSFWDMIYPNTGGLLHDDDESAEDARAVAVPPPSYDEIFPTGSSSNEDYSNAVLDNEKTAVVEQEQEEQQEEPASGQGSSSKEAPSEAESEEVILLQWKNKRKTISNDRMFLYFWLPLFISILVFASIRAVTVFGTFDTKPYLHEKVTKLMGQVAGINLDLRRGLEAKGAELGKMIEPVVNGARSLMEGTHDVVAAMTGTAPENLAPSVSA